MKVLLWTGATLALAAMVVAALQFWPMMHPEVIATAPLNTDCDLRKGACLSRLPDGSTVELDIQPRSLPYLQPLDLKVSITGLDVQVVEVDLNGVDMNMGYNRSRLARTGNDIHEGKAVLSVCVRSRMLWEARVLVHTGDGIVAAPFRFETSKN